MGESLQETMKRLEEEDVKVQTQVWNKPVGFATPIENHNVGRIEARKTRKNFTVR